jgi:hypothetical protein
MSAGSGRFIAIQGTANAKTWVVEDDQSAQGAGSQEVEKVISDSRPRHKGKLPPVVSSLFSIKAAHWRDGIRGTELGARGKERTARKPRYPRKMLRLTRRGIEHEEKRRS